MAEIKSTLDLVMERTKHLTMSAEEKTGQQKKDFEKKLKGLLQQYEDKVLAVDELMERISALQKDLHMDDDRFVATTVIRRIQPGLDNTHWLTVAKLLVPSAVTLLEQALADFQDNVTVAARKSEQDHLERLGRAYGIQGSAVVPNLKSDAHLQERLSVLKCETRERIETSLQHLD